MASKALARNHHLNPVTTMKAGNVDVHSYETIADSVATDHCGLVLKATLDSQKR